MLDVTAAVFLKNNKTLAFRRKSGLVMGGFWEYPGGKLEKHESLSDCLGREIKEELGVRIVVGEYLGARSHNNGKTILNLHAFIVNEWHGDIALSDHDQMIWLAAAELKNVQWCPADLYFVEMIKTRLT